MGTKSGHTLFCELNHLMAFLKDMGFDTTNMTIEQSYTIKNKFLQIARDTLDQEQGHILDPFIPIDLKLTP